MSSKKRAIGDISTAHELEFYIKLRDDYDLPISIQEPLYGVIQDTKRRDWDELMVSYRVLIERSVIEMAIKISGRDVDDFASAIDLIHNGDSDLASGCTLSHIMASGPHVEHSVSFIHNTLVRIFGYLTGKVHRDKTLKFNVILRYATDGGFMKIFREYGTIESVNIDDKRADSLDRSGSIEYSTVEQMENAIISLNGVMYRGMQINVWSLKHNHVRVDTESTIYIKSSGTIPSEKGIRDYLSRYGEIIRVRYLKPMFGTSQVCLVTFTDRDIAREVVKRNDGTTMYGMKINVRIQKI